MNKEHHIIRVIRLLAGLLHIMKMLGDMLDFLTLS